MKSFVFILTITTFFSLSVQAAKIGSLNGKRNANSGHCYCVIEGISYTCDGAHKVFCTDVTTNGDCTGSCHIPDRFGANPIKTLLLPKANILQVR